MLRTDYIEPTA